MSADPQATFFATLIDEWCANGLQHAVVSPGNRSSLMAVLLERESRIKVHVAVDERCASFFALGLAKRLQSPVLVWTTSGTAVAQCHAAVIEAHLARVPLLVCSADRPVETHLVRDWQTIDQSAIFGSTTRWHFDAGVASTKSETWWRPLASRSIFEATASPAGPGPVHLNLPIREPWTLHAGPLPPASSSGQWYANADVSRQMSAVLPPGRGLVVVGADVASPQLIAKHARRLGLPIVADARSGVNGDDVVIRYSDLLAHNRAFLSQNQPDYVIHIGAPLLSKQFARWLASLSCAKFMVDSVARWDGSWADSATIVVGDGHEFLAAQTADVVDDAWIADWLEADRAIDEMLSQRLDKGELSEPGLARGLMQGLAPGTNVVAATSMPVRDLESYGGHSQGLRVMANRGASGMDGLISTAAGVATARYEPTVLVIGDLSYLYDIGALWAHRVQLSAAHLVAVVVDNEGGGIFDQLPQLQDVEPENFAKVVTANHNSDIQAITKAFGWECQQAESVSDVVHFCNQRTSESSFAVVVVKTERSRQSQLRAELAAEVRSWSQ